MLSVDYRQAIQEMSEEEFNKFCELLHYSQLKERLERENKDVRFGIKDNIAQALCDCCNEKVYKEFSEKIYLAILVVVGEERLSNYIKK